MVLPYDTFGSHLVNGKSVDSELEVKNYNKAEEILSEIWNKLEIDKYPVQSQFISKPVTEATKMFQPGAKFRAKHVFETQYMTVYLMCDDKQCCSAPKTQVGVFFPGQRIPALFPIKLTSFG